MLDRATVHGRAVSPQNLGANSLDVAEEAAKTAEGGDEDNALVLILTTRHQKGRPLLRLDYLAVIVAHRRVIGEVKRREPRLKTIGYRQKGVVALAGAPKCRERLLTPPPRRGCVAVSFFLSVKTSNHNTSYIRALVIQGDLPHSDFCLHSRLYFRTASTTTYEWY